MIITPYNIVFGGVIIVAYRTRGHTRLALYVVEPGMPNNQLLASVQLREGEEGAGRWLLEPLVADDVTVVPEVDTDTVVAHLTGIITMHLGVNTPERFDAELHRLVSGREGKA